MAIKSFQYQDGYHYFMMMRQVLLHARHCKQQNCATHQNPPTNPPALHCSVLSRNEAKGNLPDFFTFETNPKIKPTWIGWSHSWFLHIYIFTICKPSGIENSANSVKWQRIKFHPVSNITPFPKNPFSFLHLLFIVMIIMIRKQVNKKV